MSHDDQTAIEAPQKVYLFPASPSPQMGRPGKQILTQQSALVFQYWPQSLTDDYQVDYVEHKIPGGSHPLYQWVGGGGRTITFEAIFTSELNTMRTSGESPLSAAAAVASAAFASLVPSADFTTDVGAALARIRSWMLPNYDSGGRLGNTDPPKILTLVFPNTKLGGSTDLINVILRSAPIQIESWFPNGQPRVATVNLQFNEIVQVAGGQGPNNTRVKFISRSEFASESDKYKFRGIPDRPFFGG